MPWLWLSTLLPKPDPLVLDSVYLSLDLPKLPSQQLHSFWQAITIAEDVSGMPALCRPVEEGGVG